MKKFFGVKNMNLEEYEKDFKPWYDQQKNITDWNFKLEFIKYCRADVELLSKTVLCFRKLFKTSLDTDPFRYTTLASLCMSVYLNKFLPDKTIMGNTTEKQDSIVCREWLNHLNNPNIKREVPLWMDRNINYNEEIHKGKVGKKVAYYNLTRPFFLWMVTTEKPTQFTSFRGAIGMAVKNVIQRIRLNMIRRWNKITILN